MISGMRKAPPISISSPRETIASRPLRQRVEHEQHGGGIVVDDGGVLGAGQLAQQAAHMIVALAALAAAEIEFERDRVAHRRDRGLDRRLGEQRAAEIGVQHGAGEIEDRPQARTAPALRAARARRRRRDPALAGSAAVRARRASDRAHRADDSAAGRTARSRGAAAGVRSTSSTEGSLRSAAASALGHGAPQ